MIFSCFSPSRPKSGDSFFLAIFKNQVFMKTVTTKPSFDMFFYTAAKMMFVILVFVKEIRYNILVLLKLQKQPSVGGLENKWSQQSLRKRF